MNIKDLLFNPTQFTIRDVQKLISDGILTRQEVASVLKDEVFNYVERSLPPKVSLPSINQLHRIPKESNMVMVWGIRDAGKTSLIGSLYSLRGFKSASSSYVCNQAVKSRYDALTKMTKTKGWQETPYAEHDAPIEMVETIFKPHLFGRTYPMTFVEVNLTKPGNDTTLDDNIDWARLVNLMKNSIGHIHLFCLDCSQDTGMTIQDVLDRQVILFRTVLNKLKSRKLIDTANAIYVVVMKADLMKAPKPYLDNAAQTLVTSTLSSFWQIVRNICYQKHIYNAQPLTCSIGNFALKDFAQIDTTYTEHIFHNNILCKCLPRKCFIERIFGFKKWWMKWVVLPMLTAAVIYGGYKAYGSLADKPVTTVQPFDYGVWFQKEMQVFHKAGNVTSPNTYEYVRTHYYQLRKDLNTERALRTDSAQAVITDSLARVCESALTTAFAHIMKAKLEAFFQTDKWSRQKSTISDLKADINAISGKPNLTAVQQVLFNNSKKNFTELDRINSFIRRCDMCGNYNTLLSLEKEYNDNRKKWNAKPFSADILLHERITDAVYNANESYTKYCRSCLQEPLNNYYDRIRFLNNQYKNNRMEWSNYRQDVYNAKKKLKNDAQWAINRATTLNCHLNSKGGNYTSLRETLNQKISEINKATEDVNKWQNFSHNLTSKIKNLFN